jgi:predicted NAD/FAD-dependent oxidoreductase
MELFDVVIVGAGIAGLSCAQTLVRAGKRVVVLDRSGFVGGRCATKSPGLPSLPVDFGPVFVHGDDPEFVAWVESFGDDLVPGWPRVVEGGGTPCQPQAFDPLQRRYALKSGLRTLAESLAQGVEVVHGALVVGLRWDDAGFLVGSADGREFLGRNLVLTLALEQTRGLLAGLGSGPGAETIRSADALLGQFASLPCLTVLAWYPPGTPTPAWDLLYPERSPSILLVSNEGPKRGLDPSQGVLLLVQARPGWSHSRLEGDRGAGATELLAATGALVGPWAGSPGAQVAHRWRYARLAPSDHLVRPLVLDRPGSTAKVGLAGDLFDVGGGLQGAWRSGRNLGARLVF